MVKSLYERCTKAVKRCILLVEFIFRKDKNKINPNKSRAFDCFWTSYYSIVKSITYMGGHYSSSHVLF